MSQHECEHCGEKEADHLPQDCPRKPKPSKAFSEYDAAEVQNWFHAPGQEDLSHLAGLFVKYSGKRMLQLSKEDCIKKVKEDFDDGIMLYNAIHAAESSAAGSTATKVLPTDAYSILREFAGEESRPFPKSTVPTFAFTYQEEVVAAVLDDLWEEVVLSAWQHSTDTQSDKANWRAGIVWGPSGVGKTRFCTEVATLLQDLAKDETKLADARPGLREKLEVAETVLFNVRYNGHKVSKKERRMLTPDMMLGLRLAAAYWFPRATFSELKDGVLRRLEKEPELASAFQLNSVIDMIRVKPRAQGRSLPRTLILAVDEIQAALRVQTKYSGSVQDRFTEPLSVAFVRALASAAMEQGTKSDDGLLVVPLVAGTSVSYIADGLEPSEFQCVPLSIPDIPQPVVHRLVRAFQKKQLNPTTKCKEVVWTGDDWFKHGGTKFEHLLDAFGGNGRALEALQKALAKHSPSPDVPFPRILKDAARLIGRRFSASTWGYDGIGCLGLLLAIAGVPVTRDTVVSPPYSSSKVTVDDLERSGYIRLSGPPEDACWIRGWDSSAKTQRIMSLPYVLAIGALPRLTDLATVPAELRAILDEAYDFLLKYDSFEFSANSFEELTVTHHALKHTAASLLAIWQGRTSVPASKLFLGSLCGDRIKSLSFKPQIRNITPGAASEVWCSNLDTCPSSVIKLKTGGMLDLQSKVPYVTCLGLGLRNVFDGVLNGELTDGRPVMTWVDTKFTLMSADEEQSNNYLDPRTEIAPAVLKRRLLTQCFPEPEHLVIVVSNSRLSNNNTSSTNLFCGREPDLSAKDIGRTCSNCGDSHPLVVCPKPDHNTLVISNNDRGLSWAFSPLVAKMFLTGQRRGYSTLSSPCHLSLLTRGLFSPLKWLQSSACLVKK